VILLAHALFSSYILPFFALVVRGTCKINKKNNNDDGACRRGDHGRPVTPLVARNRRALRRPSSIGLAPPVRRLQFRICHRVKDRRPFMILAQFWNLSIAKLKKFHLRIIISFF